MNPRASLSQSGFSIVELMVALAVGLIIVAGVGQVFVSNKQAYRYIEGATSLQDQANAALDFITQQVEMAGFVPEAAHERYHASVSKQAIEAMAYESTLPLDGTDNGVKSDTIVVNMLSSGPNPLDCTNSIKAADFTTTAGSGVRNQIEIAPGANKEPALFCNGVEIVGGIDHMKVLYGLNVTQADGSTTFQYLPRNALTAEQMASVVSVRVALLVSSAQEARPGENTVSTFDLLGTPVSVPTDRRMRRVFEATIRLRNRCVAVPNIPAQLCT